MKDKDQLWEEARERMRPYVDAVFWQDFGIGGEENTKSVNWILDNIFKPEFYKALETNTDLSKTNKRA